MKTINYKKQLEKLTDRIIKFETEIDNIMKMPESHNRGVLIAFNLNKLTMANQMIMYTVLGFSFKKIRRLYEWKIK